jgi:hypothetical protein
VRARALLLLLLAMPAAHAAECELGLGLGWPPATGNHGDAVEALLASGTPPALQLTWLPTRGVESALMLVPPANGGAWTLRHANPAQRVDHRESISNGVRRVLLTDQQPEVREVPIPETLAGRLVEGWTRTLQSGVAADQEARFHDGEVLSFRIGDDRFSGPEPRCGAGELLIEQAEALIDAAGERDPDDFPKRWNALWRLLDELDRELATAG